MAVRLLSLTGGGHSLEWEPLDSETVKSAIRMLYGALSMEWKTIYADVEFGGCSFIFQDEWDDPCLISSSDQGSAMLKTLYDALNAPAAE